MRVFCTCFKVVRMLYRVLHLLLVRTFHFESFQVSAQALSHRAACPFAPLLPTMSLSCHKLPSSRFAGVADHALFGYRSIAVKSSSRAHTTHLILVIIYAWGQEYWGLDTFFHILSILSLPLIQSCSHASHLPHSTHDGQHVPHLRSIGRPRDGPATAGRRQCMHEGR